MKIWVKKKKPVFYTVRSMAVYYIEKGLDRDEVSELIKDRFPGSKWNATHYSWYKSRIKKGKFKK